MHPPTRRPRHTIIPEKPHTWGPHIWKSMHAIAAGYPLEPTDLDKDVYRLHFENMPNVLPCVNCRDHFHQILRSHPLHDDILASRKSLSEWVLLLHNTVSRELGKSAQASNWTYEMLASVVDQSSGTTENTTDEVTPVDPQRLENDDPVIVSDRTALSKSTRMKQMMDVQRANSQRTKYINKMSNRNYGYVGVPNNAGTRRELSRTRATQRRRQTTASPVTLSRSRAGVAGQSSLGGQKRKGCGCGGRKK